MKRILIIRLSAIGDVVFASPIIEALRRTHPDAHIAWLAEPAVADLLRHHPMLDEVIVWPKGEWKRLWRARAWRELAHRVRALVRELRQRRFDTVLDLQGLLKSGVWAWLSGAHRRVGLGSREGSQLLMTETLPRGGDPARRNPSLDFALRVSPGGDPTTLPASLFMSSEYRFLAEHLGLDTGDFRPTIHVDDATRASVDALLVREGLDGPYAVIAPFTTRPQKHWFEDAWRELIPRLTRELGLPVVMLGGPDDREAADRIAAGLQMHDLAGRTTLLEAAEIIRRSRLLIGVDTGLTHMGTAFERPTVALFGSTCPYLATGSARTRVIYHALDCSPCRRRPSCGGAFTCMRGITCDEVLAAARATLQETPR
ncbi:MAG: glycosyltransferase family 9 protein [Halothiobacillaceae bacterium]|nr:MAG: glycosyltransferase family 9 protein [Halothiobacillaceae bacterium]